MKPGLESGYARLRAQLQALQAAPDKDFEKIDQLIDELEKIQLAIKAEHGLKGNNPNE
jgi:cellobiose-specific phosphotransferase system component IIA